MYHNILWHGCVWLIVELGFLVFIDGETANKIRMSSEIYRAILSAQIQTNVFKPTGLCFTLHIDVDVFKAKKSCILIAEGKTKDKRKYQE